MILALQPEHGYDRFSGGLGEVFGQLDGGQRLEGRIERSSEEAELLARNHSRRIRPGQLLEQMLGGCFHAPIRRLSTHRSHQGLPVLLRIGGRLTRLRQRQGIPPVSVEEGGQFGGVFGVVPEKGGEGTEGGEWDPVQFCSPFNRVISSRSLAASS